MFQKHHDKKWNFKKFTEEIKISPEDTEYLIQK